MKSILALITAAVLGSSLHAQPNTVTTPPCNDPACTSVPFNYMFCDPLTGNRVNKCSADPNNEPGLTVIKRSLPLHLCPDFYSDCIWNEVRFPVSPDPLDPHDTPVFINGHMADRLYEAAQTWVNLCPEQGPNREYDGSCCLRVGWAASDEQMGSLDNLTGAGAVTQIRRLHSDPTAPKNCKTDCDLCHMYVNQREVYTKKDLAGHPINFLYTEPNSLGFIPSGYQYIDAYSMFLHELGHWLGFNHSDEGDSEGDICYHDGIMNVGGYPATWAVGRRDLSSDDVCMFKKLYCCESTKAGVEEETAPALSFTIVPNPARDAITLTLPADLPHRPLTIRIVDARGGTVREMHAAEPAGQLSVNLAGIANGFYMLTLSNGSRTHGGKIVVQR